jgi:hypothetical protein
MISSKISSAIFHAYALTTFSTIDPNNAIMLSPSDYPSAITYVPVDVISITPVGATSGS